MSSDEEDTVRTAFKKAAVSTALESASNTAPSNAPAKPLAGIAVVFTGDFEWEREHLIDATKKNGG